MVDILNILGTDIETSIIDSIADTKSELVGLDTLGTCRIYSDYVSNNLNKRRVLNKTIDTGDFDYPYEHRFVLVPDKKSYYLIDMTYDQFHNDEFSDLLDKGYLLVDDELFNRYLEIVGQEKRNTSIDSMFTERVKSK